MTQRNPRVLPPPPSPQRQQRQWDTLLIGMAFGFGCGVLLTVGLVWLISGSSAPVTSVPANSGVAINASPTPTFTPQPTPTSTPTPLPPTPTPSPALSPDGNTQLLGADDPRFYILVLIAFIILSAIVLLRKK